MIGARVIKTGVAVTLTMFICKILNLEPAIFGAVSAVINIQPSIYLTLKTTKDQIMIHVLGVVIGLAVGYLVGGNPLSMGVTAILIITLYLKMKLQQGILMGIVAAIFILGSAPDQFLPHAINRTAVIFIGLMIAIIVNIVLWPPRYRSLFVSNLRESNDEAVSYFCQAVYDFARLENQEIPLPQDKREKVLKLNKESQILAGHFRNERKNDSEDYSSSTQDEWFLTAEKLVNYNEAITEKADRIYELLPIRLERRLKSDALPISSEFQCILDLLESGCATIISVNHKLKTFICDKAPVEPEEITEIYWERLMDALEQWQPRITSSYYLHALIEVAVVANEIRWVAREGKKLINSGVK